MSEPENCDETQTLAEMELLLEVLPACMGDNEGIAATEVVDLWTERSNGLPLEIRMDKILELLDAHRKLLEGLEKAEQVRKNIEGYAVLDVKGLPTARERLVEAGIVEG